MPNNIFTMGKTSFFAKIKNMSFDRIAASIFFIGILFLPLFFLPMLGPSIDIGKTLFLVTFVLLSFLFWLIARLKEGSISIPLHPLFVSACAVMFIFILSALFSPSVPNSLYGFSYEIGTVISLAALFLLMFLSSLFFSSQKIITRFYKFLFIVFGIIFVFQSARIIFGADFLSFGGFLSGNTGNVIGKWNDLGIFAGMFALLSLITLEIKTLSWRLKTALYAALGASLIALAVVNFYLVWVIVGVFSFVVFIYNFSFSKFSKEKSGLESSLEGVPEKKLFSPAPFIVMVISFIFLAGGSAIGGFISRNLHITQIEVRPAWSATGTVLKETIKSSPLLGSGPNRFTQEWLMYKPEAINNSPFWNAEFRSGIGLLPTFAVTTGVAGAVAWGVFLILFFCHGVRFLFSFGGERFRYVLFSSFVLAAYFWIVSFFYVPAVTLFAFAFLMAGIFIGVSAAEGKIKKYTFSYFNNPRIGFILVLVLAAFVMGSISAGYGLSKKFFALKNFQEGRVAFGADGDIQKAEEKITKAVNLNKSDVYYRSLAEIKTRQIAELLLKRGLSTEEIRSEFQSLFGAAISAGQSAVRFDETNYMNWLTIFRVYGAVVPTVSGAYENARGSLLRAIALNPRNPLLILEQARLEILNKNITGARKYIGQALELKPDYADAIFMLAQIEFSEGNVSNAVYSLEQASLVSPNDHSLFFQLGLLKYNTGDYTGAADALSRAVALNPEFANAAYFLGLSHYNLNRKDAAIEQFEKLELSNPDNEEVKKILGNLKADREPFADFTEPISSVEQTKSPIEE